MNFRNNATRLLDSRNVPYTVHEYDYNEETRNAVAVATAVGMEPVRVFKTLVALADDANHKPLLAVVPGPQTLNLKALAKAAGTKKVRMAAHEQAESLTGLQTGGISPLALINRGFVVFIDESARTFDIIAVSAGERGAQIALAPADLIKLTRARVAQLT